MEEKMESVVSHRDVVPAMVAMLILLLLWRVSYSFTCLALLFPVLMSWPMVRGLYEAGMNRRRHLASFYFEKDSPFYAWLTGKPFVALRSFVLGVLMALFIAAFVGLAGLSDMLFILASSGLTLFLSSSLKGVMRRHIAKPVQGIAYRWLVSKWSGVVMTVFYALISYCCVPLPDYLDPSSLSNTISAASRQVGYVCEVTNLYLKFFQEMDSIGWYVMLVSDEKAQNETVNKGMWLWFLLYHGAVFFSLARLQVETAYAINKIKNVVHV